MNDRVDWDHMDKVRAKAFMGTMIGFMNGGATAMMLSIGHRTGLFDTLAPLGAVTSQQLAEASGLNERYVREWLAAMTSADVVEYNPTVETYELPEEHRALLTRAGGPLNLSATMQYISLMGQVEDDVVDAFSTGAGVPYERYPDFQRLMAEDSAARFDAALLDTIIPCLPGAVDALTAGATLADLGCGSGYAVLLLAEAFPNSSFVGFDFSDSGLGAGRNRAIAAGLTNVEFVAIDAAELDRVEEFDFVTTFDAIHDQAHPMTVLRNIYQALKADGTYLCVEPRAASSLAENMTEAVAPFQYTISTMHCMSVSIAGGGEGLGTAWGAERTVEFLEAAKFVGIETAEVRADRANSYFVCRKS
ncbi:MAG: ubiquinone/menaquinone biosynthesis C-methylase UbiE [Verrucomicrobiales bacterium]|jgi:ubiquinone/menaquinone biosynthesis C-methylase UbiE